MPITCRHLTVARPPCEHTFAMIERPPPPTPIVKRAGRPPSANRTRPVEVRECKHHGFVEFGNYSSGSGRFKWFCKKCIAENVTRRHQKVRALLREEAGGRCAACGYDRCTYNLHFHHVEPSEKLFAVNSGVGKALATCRAEAAKCVLVCANCHGEIEAGQISSPPPGAKFGGAWAAVGAPAGQPEARIVSAQSQGRFF